MLNILLPDMGGGRAIDLTNLGTRSDVARSASGSLTDAGTNDIHCPPHIHRQI
jgi:hypothetical protein